MWSRLTVAGNVRVLNIALKTARTCLGTLSSFECLMLRTLMDRLENEQLDLCLKVLGIAASRLDAVTKPGVDADESGTQSLATEYYLLRIHLVRHLSMASWSCC